MKKYCVCGNMTNSAITIYHKKIEEHNEQWVRFNYGTSNSDLKGWFIGGKGAGLNKGYDNANDVDVRLFYKDNPKLNINNFGIGDIIVQGCLNLDINKQQDLRDYLTFNVTSIQNNITGSQNVRHIHLGGK